MASTSGWAWDHGKAVAQIADVRLHGKIFSKGAQLDTRDRMELRGGDTVASDAQRKAVKKYKEKVNRMTIEFSPAELEMWEHIQNQPKKQTYIKALIRADMEKNK